MLSTYCQSCGSKNEYQLKKPKFCGHCGEPLSAETPKPGLINTKRETEVSRGSSETSGEETDVFEVPDLTDLEYEISYDRPSFTLGSLIGQAGMEGPKPAANKARGRPKKARITNAKKKKN